ncbi:MAG: hypothetical protein JWP05_2402, partial [Microbacteriaceae bacterium]|nr:hypothetical protein [Microbacteriaceae bacterium]
AGYDGAENSNRDGAEEKGARCSEGHCAVEGHSAVEDHRAIEDHRVS